MFEQWDSWKKAYFEAVLFSIAQVHAAFVDIKHKTNLYIIKSFSFSCVTMVIPLCC